MDWLRRNWVYLICAATFPAGLALLVHGLSFPVYTDQALASELKMAVFDGGETRSLSQLGDELRALRTPRHAFMQSGISLALAGMTVAGLLTKFGRDNRLGLETPRDRTTFLSLGLGALCIIWIAEFASYDLDIRRGDVLMGDPAHFALTIGMFVMAPLSALVVWLVGMAICSRFGQLPVPLAFWDSARSARSFIVSVCFALPAALFALLFVTYFSTSGFVATPAFIVFFYVVLASRAAWLAGPQVAQGCAVSKQSEDSEQM